MPLRHRKVRPVSAIQKLRRVPSALTMSLVVIGIVALVVQSLAQSRSEALERARSDLGAARQSAVGGLERLLQPYRLSLEAVAKGIDILERHESDPAIRQILLFDSSARSPFFSAILVLGPEGRVRYNSRDPAPPPRDFSSRAYFKVFREGASKDLYVSEPFVSELSGEEVFVLAMPVQRTDGSFGGVVAGAVRVSAVRELLAAEPAWHGAGALYRADGRELVAPEPNAHPVAEPVFLGRTARKGIVERSDPDGCDAIYAWGQLERLPIVVVWSMARGDVLAAWWQRAIVIGAATFALLAIGIGLAVHLKRELMRRIEAERVLRKIVVESDRLARTDKLTGLGNRRMFDEVFEQEWRRHLRHDSPISVVLLDVDYFKRLNDALGHAAGDQALVEIARSIRRGAQRSADFVSRYGGEEFVVILPDTTEPGARIVAERILEDLDTRCIRHPAAPLGRVSVSVGIASIVPTTTGPTRFDLLDAADAALYDAKARGRNRIECSRDWPLDPTFAVIRHEPLGVA